MYSKRELQRKKKDELRKIAVELGCNIIPGMKKPAILEAIFGQMSRGVAAVPPPVERKPGDQDMFDQLTKTDGSTENATDPLQKKENRGGERANAGRKPGVTLEQSKIDNLPTTSSRSIKAGIKWLFKAWSKITDCKLIELDDDELEEFALDATQFCEYHGWTVPQGLHIDGKFALQVVDKVGGRVAIKNAHKARMEKQQNEQPKTD